MSYSIQLPTPYGSFLMNRHDEHQPIAILRNGVPHIDTEIRQLLEMTSVLPDGAVVVDAGANIGLISVPLAHHLRPRGGTVLAFEPQRLIFYMLAGNTAIAGLENLVCHQMALSSEPGTLVVPRVDPHSQRDFGMVSLQRDPGNEEALELDGEPVTAMTIDMLGLVQLDLLKIDVERMELDVLAGAEETIRRCRPVIWIEVWPENHAPVFAWAQEHGYAMFIADPLNFCVMPVELLEKITVHYQPFDGVNHPLVQAREQGGADPEPQRRGKRK